MLASTPVSATGEIMVLRDHGISTQIIGTLTHHNYRRLERISADPMKCMLICNLFAKIIIIIIITSCERKCL